MVGDDEGRLAHFRDRFMGEAQMPTTGQSRRDCVPWIGTARWDDGKGNVREFAQCRASGVITFRESRGSWASYGAVPLDEVA